MNSNYHRLVVFCSTILLFACGQPQVEPGLETVPTVEEPTQEPLPTATAIPTNTPEPTPVPTELPTATPTEAPTEVPAEDAEVSIDVVVEEEGSSVDSDEGSSVDADELDELAELFGIEIITEGTFTMEALGVSFELPEGWSGMQMMGLMAIATNADLDPEFGLDTSMDSDGVLLMFIPSGGASYEEMNSYTAEELVAEMAGSANSGELDEIELIEDRIPVTVNGYEGVRTTLQGVEEGELLAIEMTLLNHEGAGFMMMYMGRPEEVEAERDSLEILTDTLVLTVPDQAALEEAGEEMVEDLAGLFGGDVVTEGRMEIPAIGVSFEVPTGWTAISMMGFLGMVTNSSMDMAMGNDQLTEGVMVMFTAAEGATVDEAWDTTSEELFSSMAGPDGIDMEDAEIIDDRVPVTVAEYVGQRTFMQFESEGVEGFFELTILENEGFTYTMMYAGTMADFEAEKDSYEFLTNSLVLTAPDLDAIDLGGFGDLGEFEEEDGDFEGDFSLEIDEPTVIEPLPLNSTVTLSADSEIGYWTEVEVGSTYLIYLEGEADTTLHVFPEGSEPMGYVDMRSDNVELIVWTADAPALITTGRLYFENGPAPLKLSIFKITNLETDSYELSVAEGENYIVVGMDDESDIKLTVESDTETSTVDVGFSGGSPEYVLISEAGDYMVSTSEWSSGSAAGNLFIVQIDDISCCTAP
ncbi:MAG: PT domain-containing protein [Chloroflexota bacterium]